MPARAFGLNFIQAARALVKLESIRIVNNLADDLVDVYAVGRLESLGGQRIADEG